jgi:Flp pilus assembly pilin Flp
MIKNKIVKILKDKRAQADSASTLYMLLIVAIVAVVLIAVIKPLFVDSMKTSVNLSKLPSNTNTTT